ncbi:hypothetical protein CHF27_006710 [Romboutsia maritimum]|uniref:Uncharacterized protein n=1 Tax=Romboutsia maritimum TaxID=2020948 RepID=A0A371ITK4_9FIRM|nr:hypothetical protein [Romboutsia maritimum]RDY23808.1 hypothetical protein CHF27_006710 [Romboutsia maritimum]
MLTTKIIVLIIMIAVGTTAISYTEEKNPEKLILGGSYIKETKIEDNKENDRKADNSEQNYIFEQFFRPSNMPILNGKIENSIYDMYGKNYSEINIPKELLKTPQDTIINYFIVLRDAANPNDETQTGCGTLGDAKGPYPVAYNFLSNSYKKQISYNEYLKSFENKLHINLIKLNKVEPDKDNPNSIKYFVELEVIEGTNENKGVFAYYYGYIYLEEENGMYKIKDMQYAPENYLCAPYHGWSYDAKYFVEIKYKEWCSLVNGDLEVKKDGYEKKVYFKDKYNNEYYVLFYQLTNGVDIKIADYKKNKNGKWEIIYINPEKCLDKNKN